MTRGDVSLIVGEARDRGVRPDLRGADLSDANLRGANLSYANLNRANLNGADLYDANLRDAHIAGRPHIINDLKERWQA